MQANRRHMAAQAKIVTQNIFGIFEFLEVEGDEKERPIKSRASRL